MPVDPGMGGLDCSDASSGVTCRYVNLPPQAPDTAGVPGLRVEAEASPIRYRWDFGDGKTLATDHPGRAWTRDRPGNISHTYERRDRYELAVEALWSARYRINGGAWQPLGFFTTSDARDYPVRQIVAVLTRSRR